MIVNFNHLFDKKLSIRCYIHNEYYISSLYRDVTQ